MCSVQEEGDSHPLPKKQTPRISHKCMKCDAKAVAVARTKDSFCRNCFNVYFTHRFRAVLGKSRAVAPGEKVLLAFSGGLSSRVLLALTEEGLSERVRKKLQFIPTVIYIDEGAVLGQELAERNHNATSVLHIAAQCGFPSYYAQIEQVFGPHEVLSIDHLHCGGHHHHKSTEIGIMSERSPSNLVDTSLSDSSAPTVVGSSSRISHDSVGDKDCLQGTSNTEQPSLHVVHDGSNPTGSEKTAFGNSEDNKQLLWDDIHRAVVAYVEKQSLLNLTPKLRELFAETKSLTAKENLLLSLRYKLLLEIARKYGFTKVMVGDNATRLAIRLLGNVAQGRGATIPLDTGLSDNRTADIAIVRPLREFPSNEVATHVVLNNLTTVTIPNLVTLAPDNASIERLTESFINGLQVDFPSTTNTIFRTGDKLAVKARAEENTLCSLCQAPLGHIDDESVFTHLRLPSTASKEQWEGLCYGCRLTVKDMKQGTRLLPPFVHATSQTEANEATKSVRDLMKNEIKDYLLEDS